MRLAGTAFFAIRDSFVVDVNAIFDWRLVFAVTVHECVLAPSKVFFLTF